jgi:cellulose synthase/poly-beta-1,6-N-acetylglucosamine synthase-like glycosyltransferase
VNLLALISVVAVTSALILAAVWVAYPAVIGLLAGSRPPVHPPVPRGDTRVSVIIATRESEEVIRARVRSALGASYPSELLEVIVAIDAQSHLATPEQLGDLGAQVRVVRGDAPGGKATTLNAAARVATGDVFVFGDSFQDFLPDAIGLLVAGVLEPGVGAASGRLELAPAEDTVSPIHMYWAYECWLRSCEARWHSCVGVFGPINALRAALWSPLPAGLILDDVYQPMGLVLAGHRVAFVDRAVAVERRTAHPETEYRRKVRTLTGNIQLCVWMPGILNPFRNPIWLQFVFHKLGRLITPYAFGVLALSGSMVAIQAASRLHPGALIALAATLSVPLLSRPWRAGLSRLGQWVLGLQAAVVVATMNGIRGQWDVWRR